MDKFFSNYTVACGSDTRHVTAQVDLRKNVMSLLDEGWIPLGGVAYMGTETMHGFTCHIYCQAMGKPDGVNK